MLFFENTSESLSDSDLKSGLFTALNSLGPRKRVLAIPPDITRYHSRAGLLTQFAGEYYQENLTDILPDDRCTDPGDVW